MYKHTNTDYRIIYILLFATKIALTLLPPKSTYVSIQFTKVIFGDERAKCKCPPCSYNYFLLQIRNKYKSMCLDSSVDHHSMNKPVKMWPCHNQGGNQVREQVTRVNRLMGYVTR